MDKETAIFLLKKEQKNTSTEDAHGNADTILCNLLIALGYQDVVVEYDKIKKWYA
jgi:hypothetical protein